MKRVLLGVSLLVGTLIVGAFGAFVVSFLVVTRSGGEWRYPKPRPFDPDLWRRTTTYRELHRRDNPRLAMEGAFLRGELAPKTLIEVLALLGRPDFAGRIYEPRAKERNMPKGTVRVAYTTFRGSLSQDFEISLEFIIDAHGRCLKVREGGSD